MQKGQKGREMKSSSLKERKKERKKARRRLAYLDFINYYQSITQKKLNQS